MRAAVGVTCWAVLLTGCGAPEPRTAGAPSIAESAPTPAPEAVSAAAEPAYDAAPLPNLMDAEVFSERALQLTLPKADHPTWNRLRTTRVAIDEATQLYTAAHGPEVRSLAGTTVTLRGYMLPLETAVRTTHFLVSPYTPVCFFHPPAEPNEIVEVHADRPIEAGYHLVEVTGTFRLANNGEKGLFFVLDDSQARIVQRVTG